MFSSRDIHSVTSPPAKLHYVLIVYAKSTGWSADQSRMTGCSTTEKEQATQWLVGLNKTLSYCIWIKNIFFSADNHTVQQYYHRSTR